MPRGKKELAEQIIPKLREVEVEVGRGKTVLEAVCADARKPPPQGVRSVPPITNLAAASMCSGSVVSLPARSAAVRATFASRSIDRVESVLASIVAL